MYAVTYGFTWIYIFPFSFHFHFYETNYTKLSDILKTILYSQAHVLLVKKNVKIASAITEESFWKPLLVTVYERATESLFKKFD